MDLNKFYEVVNKIKNRGDWGMRTPEGLVRMLYALTVAYKPKTCLEIGTFVGLSALWIARGLEENGGGMVYSIEIENSWLEIAKQHIKECKLENRVNFILGDSKKILPNYSFGGLIDLLFLDNGDKPLYVDDFKTVENKLSSNAIIIAHDTGYDNPFESATIFRKFIENGKEYNTFQINAEYGITLIKRATK